MNADLHVGHIDGGLPPTSVGDEFLTMFPRKNINELISTSEVVKICILVI